MKTNTYTKITDILPLEPKEGEVLNLDTIKNVKSYIRKCHSIYDKTLQKKLEDIESGKYGDLSDCFEYDPESGYEDLEQMLIFFAPGCNIAVLLCDVATEEDLGDEVVTEAHIETKLCFYDAEHNYIYEPIEYKKEKQEKLPSYLLALEFEQNCEIICLSDVLDILIPEIIKCRQRYIDELED